MKPFPHTPDLLVAAGRIVWFEPPEKALADPIRFLAYAFNHGVWKDMRVVLGYIDDDTIREALDNAPAGIMKPRAWSYWNAKIGRFPAPPLPRRKIPGFDDPRS